MEENDTLENNRQEERDKGEKKRERSFAALFRREKAQWTDSFRIMKESVNKEKIIQEYTSVMNQDDSKINEKKAGFILDILHGAAVFVTYFSLVCFIFNYIGLAVVSGSSMEPSYYDGDLLFINKTGLYELQRGDIVLLPDENGDVMVKRIVGLGGEYVEAKDGIVYIDGEALDEPYLTESTEDMEGIYVDVGSYFVMGDNRNNSYDSRILGDIPEDEIIGKVIGGK